MFKNLLAPSTLDFSAWAFRFMVSLLALKIHLLLTQGADVQTFGTLQFHVLLENVSKNGLATLLADDRTVRTFVLHMIIYVLLVENGTTV